MAIFEFTPRSEIAGVFLIGDGLQRDCMGVVMRDSADDPWYFRYRFRYYDGGDPDDLNAPDTKNVYEVRPKADTAAPREHLLRAARVMFDLLKSTGFGDDLEVYTDIRTMDDVLAIGKRSKFLHVTREERAH